MVRTKEKKIKKLILFLGVVILCGLVLMLDYYVKYQKDKEEKENEENYKKLEEIYNFGSEFFLRSRGIQLVSHSLY